MAPISSARAASAAAICAFASLAVLLFEPSTTTPPSSATIAALMANGVRPRDLYAILDEERDDPLNFNRGAVYHKGSFSAATRNVAQFMWAIGKRALIDFRLEWPDLLARSGGDMPAGFMSAILVGLFMARVSSNPKFFAL